MPSVRPHRNRRRPLRVEEFAGLDAPHALDRLASSARGLSTAEAVRRLHDAGISVSLFIDPEPRQIEAAVDLGVAAAELHTGEYANAATEAARHEELVRLARGAAMVRQAKLTLNAGHGLTYRNVVPVARLEGMHELNIGHSIVSRAVLVGFTQAVREMRALIAG